MRLSILLIFPLLIISANNATSQVPYIKIEHRSTFLDRYHRLTKKTRTQKVGYEKFDKKDNKVEEGIILNSIDGVGFSTNYGDTDRVTFRIYDSLDNLTVESEWQYVNNKKKYEIYKTCYYYTERNQLSKEIKNDLFSGLTSSKTYNYVGKRIIIIDSVYDFSIKHQKEKTETGRDSILIDSLGRNIEILHFSDGKFIYKTAFLYDKFNFGKTELRYDYKPDKLYSVTEWQYGPDKRITNFLEIIIGENHVQRGNYIYDKQGRLQKIEYYVNEILTCYSRYEYLIAK